MARNKQFAVLGLGRFGMSIVRTLTDNGYDVLAVDSNMNKVNAIAHYATHVVQADVTEASAMAALGLGNFDVVIVAISGDMEASIMATLTAKESGSDHVIAKAINMTHKKILEKMGADMVVLPELEMGEKVATNLITTNVIDYINLSDEYSIAEIEPLKEWVGISLSKSNIRAEYGLNIVAIKKGNRVIVSPKAEQEINENDVLVVIGETNFIQRYKHK